MYSTKPKSYIINQNKALQSKYYKIVKQDVTNQNQAIAVHYSTPLQTKTRKNEPNWSGTTNARHFEANQGQM